jgi:hypothetical protein
MTTTPNIALNKPAHGDANWDTPINANSNILDGLFDPTSGHDHSGATGHAPKLSQANTHQSADTDSATGAIHHTLGTGATQAAAGNHQHETFGVVFTNAGEVALRGDGSIATKRN